MSTKTTPAATATVMTSALVKAKSADDIARIANQAIAAEQTLTERTVFDTVALRRVQGDAFDRLARLARGTESDAQVGMTEAHAAAQAAGVNVPTVQHVGLCLRTARACSPDALAAASDAMGTPEGPAKLQATAILVWCEHRAGIAKSGTRGVAKATRADAEQAAADLLAAASAKREADSARRAALLTRRGTTKVGGLVTVAQLKGATDDALAELIAAAQDVVAIRANDAKVRARAEREAEREAKREGRDAAKAAKAEADAAIAAAKAEAKRIVAEAKARAAAM